MQITFDPAQSAAPARPSGGAWPFSLVTATTTIVAESITELVAHLVGETYVGLDDDQALLARYDAACTIAGMTQALYCETALDPAAETEETLTALLSDRGQGAVELQGPWTHEVPLVLVRTDYEPFTETSVPGGNVVFVDPSHERVFLESLDRFGFVSFLVHQPLGKGFSG